MTGVRDGEVLRSLVAAAAYRGERLISALRIVFCAAVLMRFLTITQAGVLPYLVNVPAVVLAIAFSAWMLVRIRRARAGYGALLVSVAVDAAVCFLSLLQTLLWPSHGASYAGLLRLPDMTAMLVITYAAGFRLWPRLAALGGGLNLISCLALLLLDRARWGDRLAYDLEDALFFLIALGGVAALSLATAVRTLGLVESGAGASLRVDRARRSLAELVRDHHDARSLLSAAAVTSDLILRSSLLRPGEAGDPSPELQRRARRLKEDLEAVNGFFTDIGQKAYGDLESLSEPQPVPVAETLREAVERLRRRFPGLALALAIDGDAGTRLPGGARSLERILHNLVANAAEGDGERGATQVWIRCAARDAIVSITVDDDGPGFCEQQARATTGKPGGMGLGLDLVARTLGVVGGSLHRGNRAEGGARVTLELPAVERETAPAVAASGSARTLAVPALESGR